MSANKRPEAAAPGEGIAERTEAFWLEEGHDLTPPETPETPVVAQAAAPHVFEVKAALRWIAAWKQPHDGTSIVTRRMAVALDLAGIPVFLPPTGNFMRWDLDPGVLGEIDTLYTRYAPTQPVTLHHLIPSESGLRHALYPATSYQHDSEEAEATHPRRILFSVWEQEPSKGWETSEMARLLQRFGAHIVPCAHNAKVLLAAGVAPEKIHVIPHPYSEADAAALDAWPARKSSPYAPYSFYTMGKWEPRKRPYETIVAFLRAYLWLMHNRADRRRPLPTLTVYTSPFWGGTDYPAINEAIDLAAAEADMTPAEARLAVSIDERKVKSTLGRHMAHDCYVTASHGEAWGMPAHDAALAGRPILAPNYGGLAAFVEHPSFLPEGLPYKLGPVHPGYALPMGTGVKALWAYVDYGALQQAFVDAYEHDLREQPFSEKNFMAQHPSQVGKQIRAVVEGILGPGYAWR